MSTTFLEVINIKIYAVLSDYVGVQAIQAMPVFRLFFLVFCCCFNGFPNVIYICTFFTNFKRLYRRKQWQKTPDMWHQTCDTWNVSCDMWDMVGAEFLKGEIVKPYSCANFFRDCARFGFLSAKIHNLPIVYLFFNLWLVFSLFCLRKNFEQKYWSR